MVLSLNNSQNVTDHKRKFWPSRDVHMEEGFGTFEAGANVGTVGAGRGDVSILEAIMSFHATQQQQQQQLMAAGATGMLQQVHKRLPVADLGERMSRLVEYLPVQSPIWDIYSFLVFRTWDILMQLPSNALFLLGSTICCKRATWCLT